MVSRIDPRVRANQGVLSDLDVPAVQYDAPEIDVDVIPYRYVLPELAVEIRLNPNVLPDLFEELGHKPISYFGLVVSGFVIGLE